MKRLIAAFCLLGLLLGCGATPPSGTPDATTSGTDAAVPTDTVLAPTDRPAADVPTPPSDAPVAEDAGAVEICRPVIGRDGVPQTCHGAPMCIPDRLNSSCAGAIACTCGADNAEAQANRLCNTDPGCIPGGPTVCPQDPTCRSAILGLALSCRPGENRCSANLPPGVALTPFAWQNRMELLLWILQTDRRVRDDEMGARFRFGCGNETFSTLGAPQVCRSFRLDGRDDPTFATDYECAGQTCYWRRGIAHQVVSAELAFDNPCEAELRVYLPGATTPSQTRSYIALNCDPPR